MSRPEAAVEHGDAIDRENCTRHSHRPTLPDALARALQQAARAIRKHYPIRTRSQADRAGKLFARALFPRRAGRPRRRDVTRALQLAAQGLSRKDIYRVLGKCNPAQQHALREAMRQRKFRVQKRRAKREAALSTNTAHPLAPRCRLNCP